MDTPNNYQMKFHILDCISFIRFLGLQISDIVAEENII